MTGFPHFLFWWVSLVLLALAVLAVWLLSRPGRPSEGNVPVAHLDRLTALPAFARRRARLLLGAVSALVVVGLTAVMALIGIARPSWTESITPEKNTRDVMLCLDASGSMMPYDAQIIDSYLEMLASFDGERIGMTVFNQSAIMVFPLTDDYDMVTEYLEEAQRGFETGGLEGTDFFDGTVDMNAPGSSLIGDGLASCLDNFDHDGEPRSRSVVFATDNQVGGQQLFTVEEGGEMAKENGIRIYTLYPDTFWKGPEVEELEDAATTSGGAHFEMTGADAADGIVRAVQEQEAQLTDDDPVVVVHDEPVPWLVLSFVGALGILVLAWRFRL
ncbi:vWA domain-containing protein [Brevibacterium samyangense]